MVNNEAEFEGDSYRITHKGERFALRPVPNDYQQQSAQVSVDMKLANEERELAEALEKIREMETRESLTVDSAN